MSIAEVLFAQRVHEALEAVSRIDAKTDVLGDQMATVLEALQGIATDTDAVVASLTDLSTDVDRVVAILETRDDLTAEEQAVVDSIKAKSTDAKAAADALNTRLDAAAPPEPTEPTVP